MFAKRERKRERAAEKEPLSRFWNYRWLITLSAQLKCAFRWKCTAVQHTRAKRVAAFRNRTNAIIFNRATIVGRYIDAWSLASTTFEPDIKSYANCAWLCATRIYRDTRDRKRGNAGSVSDKSIPGYGSIRLRGKCAIHARTRALTVRAAFNSLSSFHFSAATFFGADWHRGYLTNQRYRGSNIETIIEHGDRY